MAALPNEIIIRASDKVIELYALISEREGMVAENEFRKQIDRPIQYAEDSFLINAEKIRALKQGD